MFGADLFRVDCEGSEVQGSLLRVFGSWLRGWGLGFRVQTLGWRIQGAVTHQFGEPGLFSGTKLINFDRKLRSLNGKIAGQAERGRASPPPVHFLPLCRRFAGEQRKKERERESERRKRERAREREIKRKSEWRKSERARERESCAWF